MTDHQNNNGNKAVPKLPIQQKETYKGEGKWPPPTGITILVEDEPSANGVLRLLTDLSRIVKPSQRKYVEDAKQKLIEQS